MRAALHAGAADLLTAFGSSRATHPSAVSQLMNQIADVLQRTLAGFLAVLFFWHLYCASKWLIRNYDNRKTERPRSKPRGSSFRNGPVDPR